MQTANDIDIRFMTSALKVAHQGLYTARPNPMVGCVIVKQGKIIGEGAHVQYGSNHAEIMALSSLSDSPKEATCYVTLEPCVHFGKTPPCVQALIDAQIKRVVIAMTDPNPLVQGRGIKQLQNAGIQVEVGCLSKEARALNLGFIMRHTQGRPYVRAKMALSLDGRIAMASGESQWITGPAARQKVQHLRAQSGAIITGSNTALVDNARLTVRDPALLSSLPTTLTPPLRVVMDRQARVPKNAAIFSKDAPYWHVTDPLSPSEMLHALANKDINDVLLEAGPTLLDAFLIADCVDEMTLFYAPKLLGHHARPLVYLSHQFQLDSAMGFKVKSTEQVGEDICVTVVSRRNLV